MRTHNIPFSIYKKKTSQIIPNLQLWVFSNGLKNEFEIAVVNEPSLFKPLKFYCISQNDVIYVNCTYEMLQKTVVEKKMQQTTLLFFFQ